jgi:uncharacterized Zn finger protein (UPF0148 family)
MSELEACPRCNSNLPPRFATGRIICGRCGWTDKPKNVPLSEANEKQLPETNSSADLLLQTSVSTERSTANDNIVLPTAFTTMRKAYQVIQIRVQLLGRGMTNEIMNLYVNGKRLKPKAKTMCEFRKVCLLNGMIFPESMSA